MKRLIIFDLDGTLIKFPFGNFGSSWEAIANASGVLDKFSELQQYYYRKRELEEQWASEAAKLFQGKRIDEITKKILPIPYQGDIQKYLKSSNGNIIGCISSGVDVVGNLVRAELDLDFIVCTELEKQKGILTGRISKRVPLWAKQEILKDKIREYEQEARNVVYIGDDENCIPCMKSVGISVAFNPKTPRTRESAEYTIHNFLELNNFLEI